MNKKTDKPSRFKTTFRVIHRLTWVFFTLLVLTVTIYLGNRFYRHLETSSVFHITNITISGNHILTKTDLIYYMGIPQEANLLNLNIDTLYKKLIAHPWIQNATIHRRLPDTLAIHIQERIPVALIMIDKLYYVDREGVVFDKINRDIGCDFPIITGPHSFSQLPVYQPLINKVLPLITDRTNQLISEIHLDLTHGVTLITLNDAIPVKLGFRNLPERLKRFLATYHYLRQREIVTRGIDCRYPDRVVVQYIPPKSKKTSSGGRA